MSIFDLSKTPNSNTTIAGETAAEGMPPGGVNDVLRAFAADIKRWQEDLGAAVTAGGSATAMTLITNSMVTALADGVQLGFVAKETNTGDATLAVDGLAPKAIRGNGDIALRAGNIVAGGHYTVTYDVSANAGAGAWILHGASNDLNIAGMTEETVPAKEDRVAFADASTTPAGLIRQTTWQNLLSVLGKLTVENNIATDDKLAFTDISSDDPAGQARTITVLNFLKVVNLLEELAADDISPEFDKVPIYDFSAGKLKWTLPRNVGAIENESVVDFRACDMEPIGDPDEDPSPTRPDFYEAMRGISNEVMATGYSFSRTGPAGEVTRKLQIKWRAPSTWDGGELRVRVRWIPNNSAGEGDVMWRVRAMCTTDGETINNAWGASDTFKDTRQGVDDEHVTGVMTITPADATAGGRIVLMEVARLGAHDDDTMTGNAIVTLVDVIHNLTTA